MHNPRMKVLEELEQLMDERMVDKLKPKAMAVEVTTVGKKPESEELGTDEGSEGKKPDLSKLTPEEQAQLMSLYGKLCG